MQTLPEKSLIVAMQLSHYPEVKEIYLQGIATNQATFETTAPDWEEWDAKHLKSARLVAIQADKVVGWAALTPVSGRCVYSGVAEVSVYVHATFQRQGLGKALLHQLIELSENEGFWTLQAGIFEDNIASIKLHEHCGFRVVGLRERLGKLHGQWRNVCLLERRSQKVGL